MKRILAILLAVFTLAALSFSVRGDEQPKEELTKEQQMVEAVKLSYSASLASAGKSSFHGFCGLMTSYQLYHLGINSWFVSNDGNKQFDYYSAMDKTSGGYYITPYYLEDYSMEQALNHLCQNGTKDVYNILVGFQWTDSAAGALYGHATFINGIVDGIVYFTEGFDSSALGPEGTVVKYTVEQFVDYYSEWCTYEGLIHFGGYLDTCKNYAADVFVRARFDSAVRSLPAVVGQEGCKNLRAVRSGELLHGEALVKNPKGDWYYRVEGGYISANAVMPTQVCGDSIVLTAFEFPEQMEEGTDPELDGLAVGGQIAAVSAIVTDAQGDIVLRERVEGYDLSDLNEMLYFDLLSPGWYRLEITGEAYSWVLQGGKNQQAYVQRSLHTAKFSVGNVGDAVMAEPEKPVDDGWVHRDGNWYSFSRGKANTGWLTQRGVRYYLDDTGAVCVGWQDMEDGRRFFTETGAMVIGWLTTESGTYYLDEDGLMVTGKVMVGDIEHKFSETGILQEKPGS